jgi:hypothetical protein
MEEFHDLYSSTSTRARNTGYQIKKREMVGVFCLEWGEERCVQGFNGESRGKETEDKDMDGKKILKRIP